MLRRDIKMGRGPSPPPPPPPHLACLLLLLLEPQRAPPRSFWRHSDEQGDLLEQLGQAESPIIGRRIRCRGAETNSSNNRLLYYLRRRLATRCGSLPDVWWTTSAMSSARSATRARSFSPPQCWRTFMEIVLSTANQQPEHTGYHHPCSPCTHSVPVSAFTPLHNEHRVSQEADMASEGLKAQALAGSLKKRIEPQNGYGWRDSSGGRRRPRGMEGMARR